MSSAVPEGWSVQPLREIGKCVRGLTYSPDDVADHGLLVLRSSNIQNGRLSFKDNVYVDLDVGDDYLTKNGDILICVRNGSKHLIGKSAFVHGRNLKSTHGAFMTVFRSETNEFIQHLIKSDRFFTFVSRDIGATINSINNSNLLEYRFEIPPIPEQKKIASILTSVDEVIEKTESQIAKLQDLKVGMMQEFLTQGIGHTEYKDSPVGRIPVGWEVKRLSDFVDSHRGGAALTPKDFSDTGFCVIPKKAVQKGGKLVFDKDTFCTFEFAENNKRSQVDRSYLITTLRDLVPSGPSIGLVAKITDDRSYLLAQGVYGFRLNEGLHKDFLCHISNTDWYRRLMRRILVGSTQVHIRTGEYFDIELPIPDLEEQEKISNILNSQDVKILSLREKVSSLIKIKKALMQDLLTGKVRVSGISS